MIEIWNEVVEDGVISNIHARHLCERLGFPLHLSQRQVWTFSRYITPPKVQAILFIF